MLRKLLVLCFLVVSVFTVSHALDTGVASAEDIFAYRESDGSRVYVVADTFHGGDQKYSSEIKTVLSDTGRAEYYDLRIRMGGSYYVYSINGGPFREFSRGSGMDAILRIYWSLGSSRGGTAP